MPKVAQILTIDPPEALVFRGPFTEVVTSHLKLANNSDQKVAFKVKTTAPKRYCVRPNSGVLLASNEITIAVMLQPFEFDPNEKTKHKFMIQSMVMQGDVAEADLWKDADPDKLMDTKLRVVFDAEPVQQVIKPASAPVLSSPNNLDNSSSMNIPPTPQKSNLRSYSEEDFQKLRDENAKLLQEVATLKDDCSRLRKLAMSDTISAGLGQHSSTKPQGGGLLMDRNNLILIIVLIIVAFICGMFLSR